MYVWWSKSVKTKGEIKIFFEFAQKGSFKIQVSFIQYQEGGINSCTKKKTSLMVIVSCVVCIVRNGVNNLISMRIIISTERRKLGQMTSLVEGQVA